MKSPSVSIYGCCIHWLGEITQWYMVMHHWECLKVDYIPLDLCLNKYINTTLFLTIYPLTEMALRDRLSMDKSKSIVGQIPIDTASKHNHCFRASNPFFWWSEFSGSRSAAPGTLPKDNHVIKVRSVQQLPHSGFDAAGGAGLVTGLGAKRSVTYPLVI